MNIRSALRSPYGGFALFAGFALSIPLFVTNDYYLNLLVVIGINSITVIGLDLLMGYAGQISLGHAAFYGLGAYVSGIISTRYGWPALVELLVALIVVGGIAFLIGIPTLKLHGHYLAMGTLGFGIIVFIAFQEMDFLTGGPSGLVGIRPMSIFGITFESDRSYYFLVCSILLAVLIISINVIRSRVGRALRAIHGSEVAASVLGVNIARFKVGIFVLSALYATAAGWLYAHYIGFISPSSFGFLFSIKLVTMVVIGSLGSIWGAVFGAAILTSLPEFLTLFENYESAVFGLILLVVMIFMPRGLLRGIEDLVIRVFEGLTASVGQGSEEG